MKYLCCCQHGQVRSVAARNILNQVHGIYSVLTAGIERTDPVTLWMLYEWADRIVLVTQASVAGLIPAAYASKVRHLNIGGDRWLKYNHPDLRAKLKPLIAKMLQSG